ncbi:ABC transporter ATP-binding protein [Anaerosalibacter sp. Marseille-P3206]|uniref:ABC transporter ATP-binding protein n=1 Tax=Anaerosalibacter sp. Marseille-P3206 TaxID=1871005 RepID=UPI000984FB20|nr:ABC transporter ATP-binding protein [Anaerosalibacter sp. Marseille-P3206]
MIQLQNISKSFSGKKVLDNINLEIFEGELVSLLGPSGCGKTTTLKIIAGLLKPDIGDILFNGNSVLKVPVEKRGAVIVFQDYLLFPHLNVEENIGFGLKMAKVDKEIRKKQVKKMLKLVQLKECNKKMPHELSGGQKQRVALARALAIEPKVLLLDEPFSNLDARLREDMRDLMLNIQKKLNITTILVTHDKEEALMTSDKIAIMLDGEIKQFATPLELYQRPCSKVVANFLGEKNYIDGSIVDGCFVSDICKFKTNFNNKKEISAMIRPEDIKLYSPGETDIKGIVKIKRYAGDRIYYTVGVGDIQLKLISNPNMNFQIGDEVSISIDYEKAIFF